MLCTCGSSSSVLRRGVPDAMLSLIRLDFASLLVSELATGMLAARFRTVARIQCLWLSEVQQESRDIT